MNICFRSGPCRSASIRFDKTIVTSNEPTFRGVARLAAYCSSKDSFRETKRPGSALRQCPLRGIGDTFCGKTNLGVIV
jgi:hypothetical protein